MDLESGSTCGQHDSPSIGQAWLIDTTLGPTYVLMKRSVNRQYIGVMWKRGRGKTTTRLMVLRVPTIRVLQAATWGFLAGLLILAWISVTRAVAKLSSFSILSKLYGSSLGPKATTNSDAMMPIGRPA
jgi:hypothetical protein